MARKDREIAELVTPGRLDKPIIVLRKVDVAPLSVKPNKRAPSIMERIGAGYIEQGVEEKETVWFAQGYVINDQPRASVLNDEIMQHTLGFAIADSRTGEIVSEGGPESLGQMEAAANSAKTTVTVNVTGLDSIKAQADEDAEAEAAIAAAESDATEAEAAVAATA